MKILIYGAGIIGCELAHELCKGNNEVTLLARGQWKNTLQQKGLYIQHYGQLHTTHDPVKVIEKLCPADKYDLIFVTMQYPQMLKIIPDLAHNISRYIVLTGNNVTPSYCMQQIQQSAVSEKEIAFGFQKTGGRKEPDKIVSMHFKVNMTIGGLNTPLSADFENCLSSAFSHTSYHLTRENNMEAWLLTHVAGVLPTAYLCYQLNGHLTLSTWHQTKLITNAVCEAYTLLKRLGYSVKPHKLETLYIKKSFQKRCLLYLMLKSPAGKFVISTHCLNAVSEMQALDHQFQMLRKNTDIAMPAWDTLRQASHIETQKIHKI